MTTALLSFDCKLEVNRSCHDFEDSTSASYGNDVVTTNELSEITIRATAIALAKKYLEIRQSLIDRRIDPKSIEGVELLRHGTALIDSEVPVPRADMRMDLVRWYKMRLRRIRYRRVHRESVDRSELGPRMPFLSDNLHLCIDRRRQTLAADRTSERMRSCKHLVHALGIKKVAEVIGLQGIFVTITSLEGDDFFQSGWRRLQHRMGPMIGFWVRDPHQNGRPHWHLLLYVESERMPRLKNLLIKAFGPGPSTNIKAVIPGYSTLIPYMLKRLDFRESGVTETSDLTRRASSFRAITGKRGIQFLDCASSKKWDELRRVRDGSAAFEKLSTVDITLRDAAVRNDYGTFIVLSAREIVKNKPGASSLIKEIAASGQGLDCSPKEELTILSSTRALRDTEPRRTVAHSNENKDMKPSAKRTAGTVKILRTSGADPENDFERLDGLPVDDNGLFEGGKSSKCDIGTAVESRTAWSPEESGVVRYVAGGPDLAESLLNQVEPSSTYLEKLWVFMLNFFVQVSIFFAILATFISARIGFSARPAYQARSKTRRVVSKFLDKKFKDAALEAKQKDG